MPATTSRDLNLSLGDESPVDETIQSLIQIIEQQQEQIDTLQETVEDQQSTIENLEQTVDDLQEDNVRHSKERADLCKRVSELEEDVSDSQEGGVQTEETTVQEPETPLEDVVSLPEELAEDNLTANQERARFVARDIDDYSKSVPAGRAVKSSELRRVLTAKEDSSCHPQTVSRVQEQLSELGKYDVELKKTRSGEKVVVFTDEIVTRLKEQKVNHNVVMDKPAMST